MTNRTLSHKKAQKAQKAPLLVLCLLCFFVALIPTLGQRPDDFSNFRQRRRAPTSEQPQGKSYGEYTFVRTIYDSPRSRRGYYSYGGGTWINDPVYPVRYGLPAYKVGINVVIYAMSH
jgi:hypothetical protein